MSNVIIADRKTDYLLPPSIDDWLNEDHLARFIVEVIDQLDLSKLTRRYAGRGSKAHHPATLLAILVNGYASGVFYSRKLERATYDSVAFRYLAAGSHPDHDTLATFRRRFLDELADLFVQVLELAKEMKLLKPGNVCLDGTKIHANASRHSALSHGHIEKLEVQLKAEVQELLALAEQADRADDRTASACPKKFAGAKIDWRRWRRPKPRLPREPRNVMRGRKPSTTRRWLAAPPAKRTRARSREASHPRRRSPGRGTAIRSISPTKSRASCPSPGVALSKPTTRRLRWMRRPCWLSAPASRRPPTTRSRSSRCWKRSRRKRKGSALRSA